MEFAHIFSNTVTDLNRMPLFSEMKCLGVKYHDKKVLPACNLVECNFLALFNNVMEM